MFIYSNSGSQPFLARVPFHHASECHAPNLLSKIYNKILIQTHKLSGEKTLRDLSVVRIDAHWVLRGPRASLILPICGHNFHPPPH